MINSKNPGFTRINRKGGQMATRNEIHQLLPEDLIIEILLRLPVKSLIRARVVCKNWYTIIINPSFVTKHFNHHTNRARLFVNRFDESSQKFVFSLFPDETLSGSPPMYRDVVPHYVGFVASPFNGILCLSYRSNRLALWNPATREFRSLPILPRHFPPPDVRRIDETIGFGLDPITNDYKVVWIWNTKEDINGPYRAAVYTLSTDSWRYLDVALPYTFIYTSRSNTCINGVYHWYAVDHDHFHLILSFDMANELFHEIRDIPSFKHVYSAVLAPYNNSIALIYCYSGLVVDIWVMMEEGCWTKQFTVELLSKYKFPLGFWKNGQVFMETDSDDGQVALYDPETREIKDLGSLIMAEVLIYKESLVTIRGGDGFLEPNSDVDQILNFSVQEI